MRPQSSNTVAEPLVMRCEGYFVALSLRGPVRPRIRHLIFSLCAVAIKRCASRVHTNSVPLNCLSLKPRTEIHTFFLYHERPPHHLRVDGANVLANDPDKEELDGGKKENANE